MSIIEILKNKKEPFGMWTREEQEFSMGLGVVEFEKYNGQKFTLEHDDNSLKASNTYRLRQDYQEEKEKELVYYDLELIGNYWQTTHSVDGLFRNVDELPRIKGFLGFLGEDGLVRLNFHYGRSMITGAEVFCWTQEELLSGEIVVKRGLKAVSSGK